MNTTQSVAIAIALLIGGMAGYAVASVHDTDTSLDTTSGHVSHGTMQMSMDSMLAALEGKTGDAFDEAFIREMIVHHEGAVAMAERALVSAKHEELKALATAIIAAQNAEIAQMKEWLGAWYTGR